MYRKSRVAAAVLALVLLISACSGNQSSTSTQPGPSGSGTPAAQTGPVKPVVVMQGADPVNLDPHFFGTTQQWHIHEHVFDTLTKLDWKTGQIVPHLAERWERLDPVTWRFYLKKGVKFQNGEDFNAKALKWNFDRMVDPKVNTQKWFFVSDADYKDSRVIDDYTIEITTKAPSAVVDDMLRYTYIVPPNYYANTPLPELALKPVGSGPYKVVEWVKDDRVVLERWDGYWGPKPDIPSIIFRAVPEASARIAELLTGNADLILQVGPDQVKIIESNDKTKVKGVQGGRVIYIQLDLSVKPLQDVRARQALNYAINKEAIVKSLLSGRGELLAGIANSVWKNTNLQSYPYDVNKALELMKEVGYTQDSKGALRDSSGQQLTLTLDVGIGGFAKDVEIAQAVARDIRKLGVDVKVETLEWSVRGQKQAAGTLAPLSLNGLGGFFNGVGELRWINPAYLRSPRDKEIRWQSQEFVDKYAQMRAATDMTQRKALADELQKMAFDAAAWIFLYRQFDLYGVSSRLGNWEPWPNEVINLTAVKLSN